MNKYGKIILEKKVSGDEPGMTKDMKECANTMMQIEASGKLDSSGSSNSSSSSSNNNISPT